MKILKQMLAQFNVFVIRGTYAKLLYISVLIKCGTPSRTIVLFRWNVYSQTNGDTRYRGLLNVEIVSF